MKKVFRKSIAVVVAMMMIFSCFASLQLTASAAETSGNLISNGGVEDGNVAWGSYYHAIGKLESGWITSDAEKVHSGVKALWIDTAYVSNAFTVAPNTDYIVKFYMKGKQTETYILPGSVSGKVTISSLPNLAREVFDGSDDWALRKFAFNSGDNTTVTFAVKAKNAGTDVFIDDVEATVDPDSGKIIKNGGFENYEPNGEAIADGSWKALYYRTLRTAQLTDTDAYSGSYAATTNGQYEHINQNFNCEKNTDYILTFYSKGTASYRCYVLIPSWEGGTTGALGQGNPDIVVLSEPCQNSDNWIKNVYKFNSGDNEVLNLAFRQNGTTKGYFDDISIVKDPDSGKIIKNGGFESGRTVWGGRHGFLEDNFVTDDVHSGEAAGRANSDYISNAFAVTPNTDYILRFWAKGVWSNSFIIAGSVAGIALPDEKIASLNFSSNEWVQKEIKFNSGDNTTVSFVIKSTSLNYIYVDDFEAIIDPDSGKIIKNGGFENGRTVWGGLWGFLEENITTENVKSGEMAGRANSAYISNAFAVTPNTDYIVKFYMKGQQTETYILPGSVSGNVKISDFSNLAKTTFDPVDDWALRQISFNSGNNTTVTFAVKTKGEDKYVYIDDVEAMVDPYGGYIVKNGDIESGKDYWVGMGNDGDDFSIVEDPSNSSNHIVKVSGGNWNKASINFKCEANKWYVVSFKSLCVNTNWACKYGVTKTSQSSVDTDKRLAGGTIIEGDGWINNAFKFYSGDNTSLYITYQGYDQDELLCEYYIDDIAVAEAYIAETPEVPEIESNTNSVITLKAVDGAEYSLDGGEWQTSPVFTGLFPGIEYTFIQRIASTDLTVESEPSDFTVFTIPVTGDFNDNGFADADDLVFLSQALLSGAPYSNALDVNSDRAVNILDLVALKKELAIIKTKLMIGNFDISEFAIYDGASMLEKQAAEELKTALEDFADTALIAESDHKIQLSIDANIGDSYIVSVENSNMIISAGNDYQLLEAVRVLIDRISNYDGESLRLVNGFELYDEYKGELTSDTGYNLVWHDEFNEGLNGKYWFSAANEADGGTLNENGTRTYQTSDNISVENGNLVLSSTVKTDDQDNITDYCGAAVRTKGHVEFGYGYLEMRAKLPATNAQWCSFWLIGDRDDNKPYDTEMDMFETNGQQDKLYPDLHLWYDADSANLPAWITDVSGYQNGSQFDLCEYSPYAPGYALGGEYHIFAVEWTATYIRYMVDGYVYKEFDLTSNDKFTSMRDGELVSICLGISSGHFDLNWIVAPDGTTVFPNTFEIDYIRLYQKDGSNLSGTGIN